MMQATETAKTKHSGISSISDADLAEAASRVKPVMRGGSINAEKLTAFLDAWIRENGIGRRKAAELRRNAPELLFWVEDRNPRASFHWNPKPIGVAEGLAPAGTVATYHSFGYESIYAPASAEFYAQTLGKLTGSVVAFELENLEGREVHASLSAGEEHHVSFTKLYEMVVQEGFWQRLLRRPKEVASQTE